MAIVRGPWRDVEPGRERDEPASSTPGPELPPRRATEQLWEFMRRVARDVMHLPVPEEVERVPGPPRVRRVQPYEERLEEIYRAGREREPGEEG